MIRPSRRLGGAAALWLLTASLGCHRAAPPRSVRPAPVSSSITHLQHDIDAILAAPELQRSYWGVLIKSLQTDETLYALNPRKLMMPASNMKIVTLAAAAERLGWDYTYETTLVACGPVDHGSLAGDLVVVGSGDPSLSAMNSAAVFDQWADQLKAAGVLRISGRIVGDDRAFDDDALGMGWSWDDLQDGYATGVSGLQFNQNAALLTIAPGAAEGAPAVAAVEPETSGLVVGNLVTTSSATEPAMVRARRTPGSFTVDVAGTVPLGSAPRVQTVSVDSGTRFFVRALRDALVVRGVAVDGAAVAIREIRDPVDAPDPARGTVMLRYRSPRLSVLAETMMRLSQNMYAETLLKTLGGAEPPATIAAGRTSVEGLVKNWGVADGGLIERDGSGLSRYNYVTPETLVTVLTHVHRDPGLGAAFESALPVAGHDGTLSNRLKGTAAEGVVRAKTGSMANVRALSGYVTAAGGEPLVFSILANNFETAADVNRATDAIVIALASFARR